MMVYDAVVIGSGCAALNCADILGRRGKKVALITENMNSGTSRNTGSDKQTYYKLSLTTTGKDDAHTMAQSYLLGSMNGDIALIESAYSTRAFMRLVELGLPFPTNEYGAYVGYKTDHDNTQRATSIGPLTSKRMTEVLELQVRNNVNVTILNNTMVVELLANADGVYGVIAVENIATSGKTKAKVIFAHNVVMATGAPCGVYRDSVFPYSQHGSTALAIQKGVKMSNFAEWQYGLASVGFRWNLSGSYQQVIPRYFSIDDDGVEHDFLNEYYNDDNAVITNTFLKGYQWPFDCAKLNGSSNIDRLVHIEKNVKGRRVFLDYMSNARGYDIDRVDEKVAQYLINSDAVQSTPVERLKAINRKAYELYRSHNIDLDKQYLEICVAVQHNNGGIAVDDYWQTSIKGLYAIGEAAGVFGVYRPGGSALNDTQVSGMRATESIVHSNRMATCENANHIVREYNNTLKTNQLFSVPNDKIVSINDRLQSLMSQNVGFYRTTRGIESAIEELKEIKLVFDGIKPQDYGIIKYYYITKFNIITAVELACAVKNTMDIVGSRGGAMCYNDDQLMDEQIKYRDYQVLTNGENIEFVPLRQLPVPQDWFEKVWNDYDKRRAYENSNN